MKSRPFRESLKLGLLHLNGNGGGGGDTGKVGRDQGRCDPESMIRERSPVTLDDVL